MVFKKKILVIDDSRLYVLKITKVLELAGFDVISVDNGAEMDRVLCER